MNELLRKESQEPSKEISKEELINVLKNSLYPGAKDESIELVRGYCKAAGLDIMLKPVHIVPMWSAQQGKNVDTILPGIGLYRIQAMRSGTYAGIDGPIFGPLITENLGGLDVTFPEWCEVTTHRLLPSGKIVNFTAKEYWLENYAMKGGQNKSITPNAMWMRRKFGQIAKVAEAQSLRKGFPECGSQPTAEEMEGKSFDERVVYDEPNHNKTKTIIENLNKKQTIPNKEFITPGEFYELIDNIQDKQPETDIEFSFLELARKAINAIESKESQKHAKDIISGLYQEDKKQAMEWYKEKIESLKPKKPTKSNTEHDWLYHINECKTSEDLTLLTNTMNDDTMKKFMREIDAKYDLMRQ